MLFYDVVQFNFTWIREENIVLLLYHVYLTTIALLFCQFKILHEKNKHGTLL